MQIKALALSDLVISLVPVLFVAILYFRWLDDKTQIVYATLRMGLQLLLVGYVLQSIFSNDVTAITLGVIILMILISSWIALRPLIGFSRKAILSAVCAIGAGGSLNLLLVVFGVIRPEPWHQPALIIPLAGMIYANCMNSVSIAAERFNAQRKTNQFISSRNSAFNAAMLPQINSMLAVGLVSLPGMMTGQILSGVSPLIAVRYQIVVMCMILGSAGMSAAIYLFLQQEKTNGA